MRTNGLRLLVVAAGLCWGLALASVTPEDLVRDTTNRMLGTLKAERVTINREPGRVYDLVDAIVLPHFDFERMSRLVLGVFWRQASADQRQRFVRAFRDLLVRTYSRALDEYTGQKIIYLPFRAAPDAKEVVVRTEIRQPGSPPIPVDYRLYAVANAWKVFDVSIDGISLVTNYRSTFANDIRTKGLDALIATLATRNQQERK